MATSSRIKGNLNPVFTLKVGAAAAASYADDLKAIGISSDDKDSGDLTFAEAAGGVGKQWTLGVTGVASWDTTALYKYLWSNAGSEVVCVWGPYGNATPTATKPHFSFSFTAVKPDFETEASTEGTGAEFEVELKCTTDITLVTS